jgi:hypothetical protein
MVAFELTKLCTQNLQHTSQTFLVASEILATFAFTGLLFRLAQIPDKHTRLARISDTIIRYCYNQQQQKAQSELQSFRASTCSSNQQQQSNPEPKAAAGTKA